MSFKKVCFDLLLRIALSILLLSAAWLPGCGGDENSEKVPAPAKPGNISEAEKSRIKNSLKSLPLSFIENKGQVHEDVLFYVQGEKNSTYFTKQGVTYALSGKEKGDGAPKRWAVKQDFMNPNPQANLKGEEKQKAAFSYFKGKSKDWQGGVPSYKQVAYSDLWKGIDLAFSGSKNQLEYTFTVKPEADPEQIRFLHRGATEVTKKEEGSLRVTTPIGGLEDAKPCAFQQLDGKRVEVPLVCLVEEKEGKEFCCSFQLGEYDSNRVLFIKSNIQIH